MCAGSTNHIIDRKEHLTLREGDLLFLNQNAWHEILPAAEEDLAVNFIILPEFFRRPISMIERENVLRDFLISTLAGESGLSGYLHIRARGIVPVENLIESMIWTLMDGRPGINTINQTSMGLLLMNLSKFADSINRDSPNQAEQNLIFSILHTKKRLNYYRKVNSEQEIEFLFEKDGEAVPVEVKSSNGRSYSLNEFVKIYKPKAA